MPNPKNFDVWIWNSAHPERPSRSRPNTRAPSTFPRVKRRRGDTSSDNSPPDSPFSSTSYPSFLSLTVPSLKYGSTLSRRKAQKPNTHGPISSTPATSRLPLLQRLKAFSTGEILYALISLGLTQDADDSLVQHGGLLPDIYMVSPISIHPLREAHRVCGYAHTIEMSHSVESAPCVARTQHFLETTSSDSIIVASLPSDSEHIALDKFLTTGARKQGVRGAIVNGITTDLAAHREAGFPVFSQCFSSPSQIIHALPSKTNVPVTFSPRSRLGTHFKDSLCAVRVCPGDIIVADVGGAVCVPIEMAEEVFNFCSSSTHLTSTFIAGAQGAANT